MFSSRYFVSCCHSSRFTQDFHNCIVSVTAWSLSLGLSGLVLELMILQPVMEILRHQGASQQCLHVSQTAKQDLCISKVDTQAFKSDDSWINRLYESYFSVLYLFLFVWFFLLVCVWGWMRRWWARWVAFLFVVLNVSLWVCTFWWKFTVYSLSGKHKHWSS